MNLDWKNFLTATHGTIDDIDLIATKSESKTILCPLSYLGVLSVSGKDAGQFLQGQITCNVHDISDSKSSLGAICNPKGRVITTFLLSKREETFLLLLPLELLGSVKKRLQMYVLRSAVTLTDSTDELCLIGRYRTNLAPSPEAFGSTSQQQQLTTIDLSGKLSRQLLIASVDEAKSYWTAQVGAQGFHSATPELWRSLDILEGIPWLDGNTSEEYIPQMLNLDILGGISFTKGCYTGQEIVARTHYLGKSKRQLFVAECDLGHLPAANAAITDDSTETEQLVGNVLQAQLSQGGCRMLVVLQVSEQPYHLKLEGKEVRVLPGQ